MLQKILLHLIILSISLFAQVNDNYFPNQWNLTKISAPAAWEISNGSSSIIIAIVDQGVESSHPDLLNKLVTGYDVEGNDNDTEPDPNKPISYHGTACAGVAASATNTDGEGIAGVGYNCKIMPIQVSYDDDWDSDNYATAITWAADHGADIISISGSTEEDPDVITAIDYATSNGRNGRGCVVIKSAGNTGKSDPPLSGLQFPAKYYKVLSVGATNQYDQKVDESSVGPELDVVAPSVVYAPDLTDEEGKKSGDYMNDFDGTSSATPHAAGLAGLILSLNNNLTEDEVRKIICYSADDIAISGFDEGTGWGRINAWRALDAINHTTANGTLIRDEIWHETVSLTSNVSVPSGVELTILSSATVNLGSHSIISTGGTITVETGATINGLRAKLMHGFDVKALCGIIQTAIDNWSSNEVVNIQSGTFNESITISNKPGIIIDSEFGSFVKGISINNSDGADISVTATNHLFISGCTLPHIERVIIVPYSEEEEGSFFTYNSSYIDLNDITLDNTPDGYGAAFYNSTGLFYPTFGMSFENNGVAMLFYTNSSFTMNQAYFCSNGTDISTDQSSYVTCNSGATFSGNPNQTTYGNVTWYSYSTCGLPKVLSQSKILPNIEKGNSIEEFQNLSSLYHEISQKIINDSTKKDYSQEFSELINKCKDFIISNKESELASTALNLVMHAYKQTKNYEGMKAFIEEIISNKDLINLHGRAKRNMIDYYTHKGEYNTALTFADGILNNITDIDLICDVLLAKGLIYEFSMNKIKEAETVYANIRNSYSKSVYSKLAEQRLRQLDGHFEINSPKNLTNIEPVNKFSTSNYPNPFNPTTTITYTLPANEKVVIKIYDMLGREVTELVNEFKTAGKYSVNFDASSAGGGLSSGTYFYSITAGNYHQSKKIILLK